MQHIPQETIELLINDILSQARYYLNAAEEFYPFGSIIDEKNDLKPLGIYVGEEYPDSTLVFEKLEEAVLQGLKSTRYKYAAIGIDIFIKTKANNLIEKKSAIEIRVYGLNSCYKYYFAYRKEENSYMFDKVNS